MMDPPSDDEQSNWCTRCQRRGHTDLTCWGRLRRPDQRPIAVYSIHSMIHSMTPQITKHEHAQPRKSLKADPPRENPVLPASQPPGQSHLSLCDHFGCNCSEVLNNVTAQQSPVEVQAFNKILSVPTLDILLNQNSSVTNPAAAKPGPSSSSLSDEGPTRAQLERAIFARMVFELRELPVDLLEQLQGYLQGEIDERRRRK